MELINRQPPVISSIMISQPSTISAFQSKDQNKVEVLPSKSLQEFKKVN
jgi:hypothetical protein